MLARLCTVTAVGLFSMLEGAGIVEVEVGREFAVEATIRPEVRQLGPDGNAIEVTFPEAPYKFDFKYDRSLIAFSRVGPGADAVYREITGSPWGVLTVSTAEKSALVYFRALKATEKDVKLPVSNITAAGAVLPAENPDLLRIVPQPAGLVVRLQEANENGG